MSSHHSVHSSRVSDSPTKSSGRSSAAATQVSSASVGRGAGLRACASKAACIAAMRTP
ncbi:MAG: hypothetical protein IPM79_05880 [Polyangiaceae bacterium]|nr:hypothetical protein [Polyangiaceae bacterium]